MSLRAVLIWLLLAPATADACDVVLSNASGVDLALYVEGRTLLLGPGESRRVPFAALATIEFGAESHDFAVAGAEKVLCPAGGTAELEARADGKLWLRAKEQPEGMPLEATEVHDLTGPPPNNSSKPTPLRGAA